MSAQSTKIALISFNDSRIGAWGMFQTIGAATGIDCFRANDLQILEAVLSEVSDRNIILIDVGAETFNSAGEELGAMMETFSMHLVVPVDSSEEILRRRRILPRNW